MFAGHILNNAHLFTYVSLMKITALSIVPMLGLENLFENNLKSLELIVQNLKLTVPNKSLLLSLL
jgi:hypothetical protein